MLLESIISNIEDIVMKIQNQEINAAIMIDFFVLSAQTYNEESK